MHSSESPSRLATTNTDDLLRLPREMANISAYNSLSWKVLFFLLPRRLGMQAVRKQKVTPVCSVLRVMRHPLSGERRREHRRAGGAQTKVPSGHSRVWCPARVMPRHWAGESRQAEEQAGGAQAKVTRCASPAHCEGKRRRSLRG